MFGLHGKSAKPAPRAPFSKSASGSKQKSNMATNSNRSRASSNSGEKPEKLSNSPYSAPVPGAPALNRRVQSAVPYRQRSSLGPTIKASELFRKNSEPQLANSGASPNTSTNINHREISSANVNKSKHVRIEMNSPSSMKSRFTTAAMVRDRDAPMRRPFSFSSDRSRSISVASNDSTSTVENDAIQHHNIGTGAGDAPRFWKKDYQNNNNSSSSSNVSRIVSTSHPRLSKRAFSIDSSTFDSNPGDNLGRYEDFHPQMIEMKIAEHPDEGLKEENENLRMDSVESCPDESLKTNPDLNTTFNYGKEQDTDAEEEQEDLKTDTKILKGSSFDRLLLMHSDNILHDVSELINEIKSSETRKKQTTMTKVESVEKLVDELRNDINKQMVISSLGNKEEAQKHRQQLPASFERSFNLNSLELSGIELSDITCPQQVMEQSVPNTSRDERPLTAVVLGKSDILSEADKYLVDMKAHMTNHNNGFESDPSNLFSTPDALTTMQNVNSNNNSAGVSSSASTSAYELDQEEIQRKICSALRLLEQEEERMGERRRSGSGSYSRPATVTIGSHSPLISISNPDSRPESRIDSCKSSPRIRSEQRNIRHEQGRKNLAKGNCESLECLQSQRQQFSEDEMDLGSRSARSCSCLADHKFHYEALNSARSARTTADYHAHIRNFDSDKITGPSKIPRPGSGGKGDEMWERQNAKTKQLFSFLDQVEKSDQEILFGLRFDTDGMLKESSGKSPNRNVHDRNDLTTGPTNIRPATTGGEKSLRTIDVLMRKGSVELAREILLLERKLDEAHHSVRMLEESLLNQRELNIRSLRNSERDFKKRMRMQKEEFDLAFARNEALINEMVSEKRILQDNLDKISKKCDEMDEKHKEQLKSTQQKHLDEIKRLRRMQQTAEQSLKQKLAGNKAQVHEIREMTVKGLEPEVQRIIQRHQQEMSEMRAWHTDEVRETEERYQRKMRMQVDDMREKFNREKEDVITRERESANRRLEAELKQKDDEIENLKRRLTNEIFEERERAVSEEVKLKESMHEAVRKAQIKGELELENLKQECETKLANLERKHESELKSLKDVYEAEKQNWTSNQNKRLEHSLSEQETKLREVFQLEKEKEWREKEKKMKDEFEKFRKDDEEAAESRFRRMQEKLQSELGEMEKSEKDQKVKFSQAKSDLLAREEDLFSLKASLSMKEKQLIDLQEMNMKMQEERVNLTSVIRREFTDQIQSMEEECRSLKGSILEIQSNLKLQQEQKQLEIDKIVGEKDSEIEMIGLRVKQAMERKDETILELQKRLEKACFTTNHLEQLIDEQRKEILHTVKMSGSSSGTSSRKK